MCEIIGAGVAHVVSTFVTILHDRLILFPIHVPLLYSQVVSQTGFGYIKVTNACTLDMLVDSYFIASNSLLSIVSIRIHTL